MYATDNDVAVGHSSDLGDIYVTTGPFVSAMVCVHNSKAVCAIWKLRGRRHVECHGEGDENVDYQCDRQGNGKGNRKF